MHKIIPSERGAIWFLPFLCISLLFFFLPYCSKFPSTVSTKAEIRIFFLILIFRGNVFSIASIKACYIETLLWSGIFFLPLVFSEHLLWRDSEFYHRLLCIYWEDHVIYFLESVHYIKFTDLYVLNHSYITRIKPSWSWYMLYFILFDLFANILLRSFCAISLWNWCILSFLYWIIFKVGDQSNTGFIKWIWSHPFCFYFMDWFEVYLCQFSKGLARFSSKPILSWGFLNFYVER